MNDNSYFAWPLPESPAKYGSCIKMCVPPNARSPNIPERLFAPLSSSSRPLFRGRSIVFLWEQWQPAPSPIQREHPVGSPEHLSFLTPVCRVHLEELSDSWRTRVLSFEELGAWDAMALALVRASDRLSALQALY